MRILEQKAIVFLSTAISSAAGYLMYLTPLGKSNSDQVSGVIASVSGTMLGFLLTSIAILTSVMDRSLLANLRATGGFKFIMDRLFFCCSLLLIVILISLVLLFIENSKTLALLQVGLAFSGAFSVTFLVSTGSKLYRVVSRLSSPGSR